MSTNVPKREVLVVSKADIDASLSRWGGFEWAQKHGLPPPDIGPCLWNADTVATWLAILSAYTNHVPLDNFEYRGVW